MRAWVVAAVCGVSATAAAQPAKRVQGQVLDEAGEPVPGASILRGAESAVTADDGTFTIGGAGQITIIAEGFASQTLTPKAQVTIRLVKASGEVIEVTGRAPEEAKPLEYTMSAADISTTPGAMNDALRAITILPAAARIPFSFGGLVLRGMSPRDTSVFVDGVEIPLAYHFGGITGVFPTQVLDTMRVVPSGFDVSYGRTQGGVVELNSRKPRGDVFRLGGEVTLLHSRIHAEGPLPKDGAFLASLRRSYFDVLITPLVTKNDPLPSYTDAQLRGVWGEPAKRGELSTYVIGSLDRIANSTSAADPDDPGADGHVAVNLGFVRAGASYKRKKNKDLFTLAPHVGSNILSLTTIEYDDQRRKNELAISRRWYQFGARGEWLRDDPGGFVRGGLDIAGGYLGRVGTESMDRVDDDLPLPGNTVLWSDAALWLETRRHWNEDKVSIRPGLRLDRFGLGNQWALDPRINGHVTLSPVATLRGSLGRFHQPPSAAHFDEFADNLKAQSSYVDQATLAVEWKFDDKVSASLVGFWHEGRKTLVDIADRSVRPVGIDIELIFRELLEEQIGLYAFQDNVGKQRSYGAEGQFRYDASDYRVLANVAWSRAKRQYEPALKRGWEPYGLDQPLRMNLLFATTAWEWNIGSRLTVVSGNPINVIPAGTVVGPDDPEPPSVLTRLPTFWQLDVRIDRTWDKDFGHVTLFFDIQNITNHRNVEYRDTFGEYRDDTQQVTYRNDDVRGLPILPYIGIEWVPR